MQLRGYLEAREARYLLRDEEGDNKYTVPLHAIMIVRTIVKVNTIYKSQGLF